MQVFVGTSGFLYKHWNNGVFYPRGVKDRLMYALERMNAIEINATFYSIPKPETVASWVPRLQADSRLILKAPQSVSHRRRLKLHSEGSVRQGEDLLNYFIEGCLQIPESHRGPVLLQLPERLEIDLTRLEPVLALFSHRGLRVALEVRHASWFAADTLDLLEKYGSALVASDWVSFRSPLVVTADFIYLRRHGPGSLYSSRYDEEQLRADVDLVLQQPVGAAYVLFNNDVHGYAPENAMRMRELLAAAAP
ncbi:Uncharacterized conserved protein YecE, DUF72 family [Noviherbaspirillum humi]|uniref:Uncharacterized conserved protein YecE, DUF72 family n=1 Tax=Noviherbaspirillum humi TaxID=1688639 RepID=A0A239FG96_9BURK|nr:DUF72 domain-containing protein [Noviherbaspirillum humi]SNS55949.1 Uncharacterized conserved protein YecE, DUF72 family [Noviherbaspirillum humi]